MLPYLSNFNHLLRCKYGIKAHDAHSNEFQSVSSTSGQRTQILLELGYFVDATSGPDHLAFS